MGPVACVPGPCLSCWGVAGLCLLSQALVCPLPAKCHSLHSCSSSSENRRQASSPPATPPPLFYCSPHPWFLVSWRPSFNLCLCLSVWVEESRPLTQLPQDLRLWVGVPSLRGDLEHLVEAEPFRPPLCQLLLPHPSSSKLNLAAGFRPWTPLERQKERPPRVAGAAAIGQSGARSQSAALHMGGWP